jgi:hypothetical protein
MSQPGSSQPDLGRIGFVLSLPRLKAPALPGWLPTLSGEAGHVPSLCGWLWHFSCDSHWFGSRVCDAPGEPAAHPTDRWCAAHCINRTIVCTCMQDAMNAGSHKHPARRFQPSLSLSARHAASGARLARTSLPSSRCIKPRGERVWPMALPPAAAAAAAAACWTPRHAPACLSTPLLRNAPIQAAGGSRGCPSRLTRPWANWTS